MRSPGRPLVILLLVLALPAASAAAGEGSFTFEGAAGLVGAVTADVETGAFAVRALDAPCLLYTSDAADE